MTRWSSLQRWRADLGRELGALPETLRQFREGVADFQVIAKRLASSTEGLQQFNDAYAAAVTDRVRQLNDAAAALQRHMARLRPAKPGTDLLESAIEDFNRTVATLIELNPFLRPNKG